MKLSIYDCKEINVTVADGIKIACDQIATGVRWSMSCEVFVSNLHILPIGGYDLILGVDWMK